jgi:hypothetical protein
LVILNPDAEKDIDFPVSLKNYIDAVDKIVPIRRFHFAGAYIQHKESGDLHITHGIPGDSPLDNSSGHFNQPPDGFEGIWMPVNPSLTIIRDFISKSENTPDIILEVHHVNIDRQIEIVNSFYKMFNIY